MKVIYPKKRQRLIEPFAGSGALSLALDFEEYYLNDINGDLINVYKNIKEYRHEFIYYAKSFFNEKNNQETQFYELREKFNHSDDNYERSALFIYLNRHAFNGLCRYNSKGFFNVPFGKYKKPYFPEDELFGFLFKSDRVILSNKSYQEVFCDLKSDDIIYCDPPYMPLNETSSFTAYTKYGFDDNNQAELASIAKKYCQDVQCILISNHDTEKTRMLYQGADIKTVLVQRNISAKASSRQKVGELLAVYSS